MQDPQPAFFLQPHFDDVPLSCGGTAAGLARDGVDSHILTLFGSDIVPEMVGEFAEWKHERWQLTDLDAVVATRRAEDTRAATTLGCTFRWLGLPDAIYRVGRYTSDGELYGGLLEEETGLAEHLAREIPGLPEWTPRTRVFVPLAVGSHVDHQIAFEAGCLLAAEGAEVWAYEDLPYAIHSPHAVAARLAQVSTQLAGSVDHPIGDALATKLDAIDCYRSQLPVIFRFTDDWREAVARHAHSRGDGRGPAERFWRVKGR